MLVPSDLFQDWLHCCLRLVCWSTYRSSMPIQAERRLSRPSRPHWVVHLLLEGRTTLQMTPTLTVAAPAVVLLRPQHGLLQDLEATAGRLWLATADFEVLHQPGWRDPLQSLSQPAVVALSDPQPFISVADAAAQCGGVGRHERLLGRPLLDAALSRFLLLGFASGELRCRIEGTPRWLEDLHVQLRGRATDPDLDLTTMARLADVDRSTLCRIFTRYLGLPPMAWLRRERLSYACQLLGHADDCSVAEIATRCGYRSQSLFCHHFRTAYGMSARAWRHGVLAR